MWERVRLDLNSLRGSSCNNIAVVIEPKVKTNEKYVAEVI